ncbi:MAG: hypothetical protein MJ250_04645 [Alphaproteobacteria bacterium]|nr:hypothetical protein [Alphaproteobacteria bacterium]
MSGINSLLNNSLFGMQSAMVNFNRSASRVASIGSETPVDNSGIAVESSELPVPAVSPLASVGTASTAYVASAESYAEDLVNMHIAKNVYQMGIAAYKVANEMSEELISMVQREG